MATPIEPIEPVETVVFDAHTFERLSQAYQRLGHHDVAQAWHLLEAMHVLGQTRLLPHARSHCFMLGLAWRTRDLSELGGQFLRLLLVPLGHLLGRLPLGNTGRANISAFQPMTVTPKLWATIRQFQSSADS
ncbi:DUF3703 domain-containing protein [Macromonas nakdongensis]|uniref:DUF3703 domain-containing protein n=1 Tax=Macromonas nakdongensis TaxID=1843082 RepID=UPI000C3233B0|nr:DUF3703 domain-containing protein [Macromonas nakdongensis]